MAALGDLGVILKPFSYAVMMIITTSGRPIQVYKMLECLHTNTYTIHMCIQKNHGEMDETPTVIT